MRVCGAYGEVFSSASVACTTDVCKRNTCDKKMLGLKESAAFTRSPVLAVPLFLVWFVPFSESYHCHCRFADQVAEDEEDDGCEPKIS